ncbi:hypothetical protein H1Z61_17355 [Bacillus aquiflavi]|uniref:Uncharacterized protein n=1 Tax=Bacillus aquiflavi TaxID=2672567 RepID=A0A6B3VY54_9BACI|nr:hypothetical protein [Bacillus aquiflavi]MBA4538841.1 hypothetical protein [Bacillus aquiflavi]NEY83200.1 hypothetical protein [Bacillus aquiflavi]
MEETKKFLKSKDGEEKNLFKEYLYSGNKYKGTLLDGNQYLIKKENNQAIVIDSVSEEYSNDYKYTRFQLPVEDLIYVINSTFAAQIRQVRLDIIRQSGKPLL